MAWRPPGPRRRWGIQKALRETDEDDLFERLPSVSWPSNPASGSGAGATPEAAPLVPPEVARRCREALAAETRRLPAGRGEEALARHRYPRSRSEAQLRGGAALKEVASAAALRVLERWIHVLRSFASRGEVPRLAAALVHGGGAGGAGGAGAEALVRAGGGGEGPAASEGDAEGRDRAPRPPAAAGPLRPVDALGDALRRLAPRPAELEEFGRRWDFAEDVLDALALEQQCEPGWPDTAERRDARRTCGQHATQAAFLGAKDRARTAGGAPGRRTRLSVDAHLRLTGDFPWGGFQPSGMSRSTYFDFQPQLFLAGQPRDSFREDQPGPTSYVKPPSAPGKFRRARFASTGKLRPVGAEVTLSQRGRFFFSKGDPFNAYRACDDF